MRVLLVSIYELGRQPVHVASPRAALEAAGHQVMPVDLAVDRLNEEHVSWAEAVAISVPMHTAARLGTEVVAQLGRLAPDTPVALYGLYAGVAQAGDARLVGEYEPALVAWVDELARGRPSTSIEVIHTGRSSFHRPNRSGMAGLEAYARLEHRGQSVLAGAVEASHGCRHRCRHCPIPSVYDGRMRVVPADIVLADIDDLVTQGAEHITFGDPDFLNAPRHSLDLLTAAHERHPHVTWDATVKVEHIIDHRDLWAGLAAMRLLFVVSAFESVDEVTLEILDKGHTVADMARAVSILRTAGIEIRPTWLPFLPWTDSEDIVSLFRFLDAHDLNGVTDPVQMAIKLLIPKGSLLEDHPAVEPCLTGYDQSLLTWSWVFADPTSERLQKELESIAAEASDCGRENLATLDAMRQAVEAITGEPVGEMRMPRHDAPRLTESWFCCAEPTANQTVSIRIGGR